jgi:hypothetical protein
VTFPTFTTRQFPGEQNQTLGIQGDFQFFGEEVGIEWAAGEKAAVDFDCGDLAFSVVHFEDDAFGTGRVVDVNFAEVDAAFAEEMLDAAAIAAPSRAVHGDFAHKNMSILAVRFELCARCQAPGCYMLQHTGLDAAASKQIPSWLARSNQRRTGD